MLDADGVPIKVGDTVWMVDDPDGPYRVTKVTTKYATHVHGYSDEFGDLDMSPSQLTHERPEIDSWERLEEDAKKLTCDYFGHDGGETCETCSGYMDSTPQGGRGCRYAQMADLVRRAKALAERDA